MWEVSTEDITMACVNETNVVMTEQLKIYKCSTKEKTQPAAFYLFILQALKESSNFKLRWKSVALLVALVAGSGLDILVGLQGGNVNLETR